MCPKVKKVNNKNMQSLFGEERTHHIGTALLVLLVVLSVFFVLKSVTEIKAAENLDTSPDNRPTITVSGEAEVEAVPDMGSFNFSVSATEDTVEEAQSIVTESTNDILSFLEEAGVEEEDIKTSGYNVYPRYDYTREVCTEFSCPPGERVLVGYEVSHTITVTVRDTEQAGALLSGVGSRGATNISSLQFEVDEDDALYREARQKAIAEAKAEAEALAEDLGVSLVRIVNFNENGNTPPMYYGRTMDLAQEDGAAPKIPTGENTFISRVQIVYEIQ